MATQVCRGCAQEKDVKEFPVSYLPTNRGQPMKTCYQCRAEGRGPDFSNIKVGTLLKRRKKLKEQLREVDAQLGPILDLIREAMD